MRRCISIVTLAVLIGRIDFHAAIAEELADQAILQIIKGLRSDERSTRFGALDQVKTMAKVPETLVAPLVSFVHLEAESDLIPKATTKERPGRSLSSVPLTGEEVSLVRIKADPIQYVGKSFIICGALDISNYYNFGFADAAKTHSSFGFQQVTADAKVIHTFSHVYVNRTIGRVLSDAVTRSEENGNVCLVRLKCTISKERVAGNEENALSAIEGQRWQFLSDDGKSWEPWNFDGSSAGCDQLTRADRAGVQALVKMIIRDQEYQNEIVDLILRLTALTSLRDASLEGALNPQDVVATLKAVPNDERTSLAKAWAERLADKLKIDPSLLEERKEKVVRPVDLEGRAATLLRSAKSLEKAKKIAGARALYKEVAKKYPGTRGAKEAEERVRFLGGK